MTEYKVKTLIEWFKVRKGKTLKLNDKGIDFVVQALEEIQQYRAIGTVEEFKAYKLGDCMNDCEHYENCSNYIYSKGYNKAIDDFIRQLEAEVESSAKFIREYDDSIAQKAYYKGLSYALKIAEQLKGE